MRKLPIYLSHGYREREAVFNRYFGTLIDQCGFIPSLDPPSEDVNSAKLEKHLKHTVGLIAIVANRNGQISPYIRYEIDLAIRIGKPVLVFIEDSLPDPVLPGFILKKRFSTKSFFRDYYEHQNALDIFKSFVGSHQLPRYQSLTQQKSAILLGFHADPELEQMIQSDLISSGYSIWDSALQKDDMFLLESQTHFHLSHTYLAICMTDKLSKIASYYLGAIRAIQIPTILLTRDTKLIDWDWIPTEFQSRFLPSSCNDSISIIQAQVNLYEEDFVVVDNEKKWESYVNALASTAITTGEYSTEIRERIVNNIYMGDKFENISGNLINKSPGNNTQALGNVSIEGSFIQERYGPEFTDALTKVAQIINEAKNADAKELFESLKEELVKEKPKKSILKTIWSGIITAVPLIKSSVEIFEKVSGMMDSI